MSVPQESLSFKYHQLYMINKIDETQRIDFINYHKLHLVTINEKNETLLHVAAKYGDTKMTKLLVQAGSEVNAQDNSGKTPIRVAIQHKPREYLKVIEILCESNANIHIVDKRGKSVLQLVFDNYNPIYDKLHTFFLMLLYAEAMYDSQQIAKQLINLQYPLCQAVLLKNSEVIEQMIVQGCSADSYSSDMSFTALGKAVQLMDLEIIKVLVKYGVNVDLCDKKTYLPIFYYGTHTVDKIQQPEIIKILLNKSVLLKDLQQQNVIYNLKNAFKYGNKEVICILLEHCDDILIIRDDQGQTPLHYLCSNDLSNITELLQDRKIDVNARDQIGVTPLYVATQYVRNHIEMFEFLLKNNADVNAVTLYPDLEVPLFSLCRSHSITEKTYFEVIQLFLQYNLDIQYVGSMNNLTIFDIIQHKTFYMAEPLLAHLALLDIRTPILECIYNKINSNNIFKNSFDLCKNELVEMKNNIIKENLTLYDIVVDETIEQKVLKRCRFNSNSQSIFEKVLEGSNSESRYYFIIQKRISSIILKLELLPKAAPILCKMLKICDPCHIVVTEILNYLNVKDLRNLIKSKV